MSPKLLLVGGGRMGAALVGGLVAGGWADPASLAVLDTDPGARERIAASHPGVTVVAEPVVAEGVVLAVKPDVAEAACRSMMSAPPRRLLSVVAGLSTARLAAALPPGTAVVRAMPNTPALVGAGVSVISGGDTATSADLDWAESVLGSVGTVVRLPERYLDAVTG
ncbi:MAG: NAD(P)-binding domain-containing protein, partial [Actinomycetota bacterium]|nr:NAD(P)-binding domain-containing protein [Actinomycetota bacterium]